MCWCTPSKRTPCCGPQCCKEPGGCAFCTAKPKKEWVRYEPERCELCSKIACWSHPTNGLRCNTCPRPTWPATPDQGVGKASGGGT